MAFTMPDTFRIRVSGACPTRARTEIRARQHRTVIDEPPAREGTDLGPSPLETMLSSYLGCTNVVANMIAEEMGITIRRMNLALVGHFDTRGVFNKADVTVPFPVIELVVDIDCDADDRALEELKATLARRCPVSMILRQAGSEIRQTWNRMAAAAE